MCIHCSLDLPVVVDICARRSRVLELVKFGNGILYVAEQLVGHVAAEALTHNNSHDYSLFKGCWKGVGRNHPSILAELVLQVILCPLALLGMLILHLPDEQRIGNFGTVVPEWLHLSNLAVQVLGNLH